MTGCEWHLERPVGPAPTPTEMGINSNFPRWGGGPAGQDNGPQLRTVLDVATRCCRIEPQAHLALPCEAALCLPLGKYVYSSVCEIKCHPRMLYFKAVKEKSLLQGETESIPCFWDSASPSAQCPPCRTLLCFITQMDTNLLN